MRRAANIDRNQPAIVAALRAAGATVQHLHNQGMGCPDIIAGFRGVNYLIEIKDGSLKPSARKLTQMEQIWHDTWAGQVDVVESEDEALNLLGLVELRGKIK